MSQASKDYAREMAISLYMTGTPTLGKTIDALQLFDRNRDKAWRDLIEEHFCEGVPEAPTCEEKYVAWHKEHPASDKRNPYPDGCPKPCETCKSIRGMSP